jgi:hypothetical protein
MIFLSILMFPFILTLVATMSPYDIMEVAPQSTKDHCADVIGIPRYSDNFSEEEWWQFVGCVRDHMKHDV